MVHRVKKYTFYTVAMHVFASVHNLYTSRIMPIVVPAYTCARMYVHLIEGVIFCQFLHLLHLFRSQSIFLFSVVWSIGATSESDGREKFDLYFRDLVSGKLETHPIPEVVGKVEVPIPPENKIYDYMFDANGRGKWVPWLDQVKNITAGGSVKRLSDIIVPTIDTVRYSFLMDLMIKHGRSLLFVGNTGTGKSAYVKDKLMNGIDKNAYIPNVINFSAQTSANQAQDIIMSKLDRRRKGVYGPPLGKK